MVKNCVFLSHQHDSIGSITQLADELRFRGIVPWVDKLPGGFRAGDDSEHEARRVIKNESSAFVLYLTDRALCSDFIGRIELPEALLRKQREPSYPIVVISPHYRFSELRSLTKEHFGFDLAQAHGYTRSGDETTEQFLTRVSRQLLHRHVHDLPDVADELWLSVNTYERMASAPDEYLYLDATHALEADVSRTQV